MCGHRRRLCSPRRGRGLGAVFPRRGHTIILCVGVAPYFSPAPTGRLFFPAGDGLFPRWRTPLISPPAPTGAGPPFGDLLSPRRGVRMLIFAPAQAGGLFFPCRGHTFSPAAERKYQRDAAREGLFTETPLSGLSLLRGKSQLRSRVLSLYSLLSFCCRSAVADVMCTRLRSPAVRFAGLVIEKREAESWSPFKQAPFPRSPVLPSCPRGSKGPRRALWPRERNS